MLLNELRRCHHINLYLQYQFHFYLANELLQFLHCEQQEIYFQEIYYSQENKSLFLVFQKNTLPYYHASQLSLIHSRHHENTELLFYYLSCREHTLLKLTSLSYQFYDQFLLFSFLVILITLS